MSEIKRRTARLCQLHERAAADYSKCIEFNRQTAELLDLLEDIGIEWGAERALSILVNCNPKEGAHCEKASLVANQIQKLSRKLSD